jgi:hypothetical protein
MLPVWGMWMRSLKYEIVDLNLRDHKDILSICAVFETLEPEFSGRTLPSNSKQQQQQSAKPGCQLEFA